MDYLVDSCSSNLFPYKQKYLFLSKEFINLLIISMSYGVKQDSILIILFIYLAIRPNLRQDIYILCIQKHLVMFSHE